MNICHVTSVHPLNDGRIYEKECISLSKAGHVVYLVGAGDYFEANDVNIVSVGSNAKNRFKRFFKLDKEIIQTALSLECDVYHLHDPELLRYAMLIKRKGHSVIFDSHEDVPRQIADKKWIPFCFRKIISFIYEKWEKHICKRIDYVVAATEKISSIFMQYGIKTETINNYPIEEGIEIEIKEREKNVLCFAGGLSESNGIRQLIDVVCELDEVRLILAGPMEECIRTYLEEKKCDRIQYKGIIRREEVINLYCKSTIGIVVDLPTGNNIDGLPIKLFEYMSVGLPIITSDFPLRHKIFEKYLCGKLVDPFNHQEYKKTVLEILRDNSFQKQCSENGIRAVSEEYNWKSQEKTLCKIYMSLEEKNA